MTKSVMFINFGTAFPLQRDSISKIMFGLSRDTGRYKKSVAYIADDNTPFEVQGVQAYPFKENRVLNRIANKWFRMGAFTWQDLVNRINSVRPDILHFQNKQWLIQPILKRLKYRPKVVVHYHLFGETLIPKQTDLCIVVSKSMVDYLQKTNLDDKPVKVLYNFIPTNVAPVATSPRARSGPVTLLFGGGAGRHKGIHELIQAAEGLAGEFVLSLAGRETDRLPTTDPRIRKLGLLSGDQYAQMLRDTDVVVMPSRIEPFGLVAIEALSLGKVLLHTGVDGLAEFTSPECSVIVQPNNVDSLRDGLARAIHLIEHEPEAVRLMGEKAKQSADQFSLERAINELEDMYDQLFV